MNRRRMLLELFARMFSISAFVLGGGFAIIAVADEVFSKKLKWTEEGELLGQLSVFQMVPGMICTNTAIYLGNKMAGPLGAAVALAGTVLPSLVIFTFVTVGYDSIPVDNTCLAAVFSGLRAALAGIIASLIVRGWRKNVQGYYGYAAVFSAVLLMGFLKVSAPCVILMAAAVGIAIEFAKRRLETRKAGVTVFRSCFWILPLLFLKYGSLAFGGGYVLVPMYMEDFVGASAPYLQIAAEEFANVMALTQMTPGSISVNCATFFGYRMFGVAGSVVATIAMVLPNYILLLLLLRSMDKYRDAAFVRGLLAGIRPVATSLMMVAAWAFAGMSIWTFAEGRVTFNAFAAAVFAGTAAAVLTRKLSVVQVVAGSAALSAVWNAIAK